MKFIKKALIITGLVFALSHDTYGQSNFFGNMSIELSYNNVDAWEQFDEFQNDNNDGRGFGIAINYALNQEFNLKLKYSLNTIHYRDLNKSYTNSYYQLDLGYNINISDFTILRPSLGLGVINLNQYSSIQTQISGRPETKNIVHYDRYDREPFLHLAMGAEVKQYISKSLSIGLAMDILYSAEFELGRTILSPFVELRIFR